MDGFSFRFSAEYGLFRKPYANHNYLTHSIPSKGALFGILGGVIGCERKELSNIGEDLSRDIKYNIVFLKPLQKKSISFYMADFEKMVGRDMFNDANQYSPKPSEYLYQYDVRIYVAINDNPSEISKSFYQKAKEYISNGYYCFNSYAGHVNCFAKISDYEHNDWKEERGDFETLGCIDSDPIQKTDASIFGDDVSLFRENGLCNSNINRLYFQSEGKPIMSNGDFYQNEKNEQLLFF